ncbi:MAG: 3,4-dihydroxyphenylacetate 2,3-dioxygenase [Xanthobacteraceae bacterium]
MGQIVLAAKVTHVPSLLLSEREGALKGRRKRPIESLKQIGKRARERGADTFLIFDTHWLSNFGFHINANERHTGNYTSHEAPHMIQDLAYDYPGNPVLADLIVEEAVGHGLDVLAHRVRSLALEYGSIVPMRYMNADGGRKVLPVASPLFASVEENRKFGEACRRAILRSESNVAVLASGSLSHKVISNRDVGEGQWDIVSSEFNRQMDLRVLELWRDGRYREFVGLLPEYATKCSGEALMADTAMLFGLLGWENYDGKVEQLCDYFSSSGTGQVNVEFHLN